MTFNEKLAELNAALVEKAEELGLAPIDLEASYSVPTNPIFHINARFTDSESLKQLLRNEHKQ